MRRGLIARIDLRAARSNLKHISKAAGGRHVIAVVKADAYGHGSVELSRAFLEAGAQTLAVAFVSEAARLREAGITSPVLVLFDRSEIESFFDLDLTPVIHDMKTAQEFSRAAQHREKPIKVHVKVDTGMGRMGLEDPADLAKIAGLPGLELAGLMSHLSDADLADKDYSLSQVERFQKSIEDFYRSKNVLRHISNSAAVFACPEAHMDAVRPGLSLYGISPFEDEREGVEALRPVLSVSARILTVRRIPKGGTISYGRTYTAERDMLAAVLATGYADGYSRALSNQSHVIVRGRKVPVTGRVCMDLTMADVTQVEGVSESDEAVLLGSAGGETITAWELARGAGTIPYEILTSLGARAMRVYQ